MNADLRPDTEPAQHPRCRDDRPTIRIRFVDFWDSFDPCDNVFTRLLETRFALEHCDEPDFIVYSVMGGRHKKHLRHDCVRIFYTGENIAPDWNTCDWAFTFEDTSHPRHYRLPLWGLHADPQELVKPAAYDPAAVLARKTKFCAFLVSNPFCRTRNDFFRKLSRYKPVDSGGKVLNTLGHGVSDKETFLADYKFTIAFENESHPGYTTEKIIGPMRADSIPIYWGDPLVGRDFDTRSFLSAHDSQSLNELLQRVIEVDSNPDLHQSILAAPWYRNNRVPPGVHPAAILDQFTTIFHSDVLPVARTKSLGRLVGLDRLPKTLASIRRRCGIKYRKLTRNA